MKKGKGRFLSLLVFVFLLLSFLLPTLAVSADVNILLLVAPEPMGPGPPIAVLVLIALGAVVFVKIVHPSAPPFSSGGFFGYLNLNNINDAYTEYGNVITSSYSHCVRRTRKAVNAVTAYNKPITLMG